jgi:hypothetical protein
MNSVSIHNPLTAPSGSPYGSLYQDILGRVGIPVVAGLTERAFPRAHLQEVVIHGTCMPELHGQHVLLLLIWIQPEPAGFS